MALPHRIVGLICELGTVQTEGKEFPDGSRTVAVEEEDRHKLRWHEHMSSGSMFDIFRRHETSVLKATHHYYANFPKQLLLVVQGTLQGGSEPYDVTTSTKEVLCNYQEDFVDNLPSWMTVWLEPAECVIDYLVYTYDFENIDEGHPEDWNSVNGTTPETYDENSARAEAQNLFDLYCAELRNSLQPFQQTSLYADNQGGEEPIYPRWKDDTEYEDPEVEPYEPQACPTQTSFICPWYKSMVELSDFPNGGGYEGLTTHTRIWYDFSFKINKPEWGPWTITDGTGIVHPEQTFSGTYTYYMYFFEEYVISQPPDEGDYAHLPNHPPYWSDEDQDGIDDTYWVPRARVEAYEVPWSYTIPEWTEYKSYEFDYPFDTRSNYDVKSRWKIKCEYRPDPTCCGPAGKQITFGIKIYRANLKSAVPPYENLEQQSPTTQYRNCKLKGYGHGRSGDRGYTAGRGIRYFENHNCPFPNELGSMHWAYYGTMVRPIFTTSEFESVVYVTKTIGEEWTDAYDIEIPSFDGKVTYIKDFWIESITNA